MANVEVTHETVLGAGTGRSRLARVYAESYFAATEKAAPGRTDEAGAELDEFVRAASARPDVALFLADPTVARRGKAEALSVALRGGASDLLRGLIGVLAQNNRLGLLREVAAAYRNLLDRRAGRVGVKVTAAVPLTDDERAKLVATLKGVLRQEPVLSVRVDPELLGGLVVQVGDAVMDTSVRSRLQSLRALLLDQ